MQVGLIGGLFDSDIRAFEIKNLEEDLFLNYFIKIKPHILVYIFMNIHINIYKYVYNNVFKFEFSLRLLKKGQKINQFLHK